MQNHMVSATSGSAYFFFFTSPAPTSMQKAGDYDSIYMRNNWT